MEDKVKETIEKTLNEHLKNSSAKSFEQHLTIAFDAYEKYFDKHSKVHNGHKYLPADDCTVFFKIFEEVVKGYNKMPFCG